MYYLYLIRNNYDATCYIGYTDNLKRRWKSHRNVEPRHAHKHLYRAIVAHGRDNFSITWLEEHENLESVKQAEIDAIAMFKSSGVRLYNHSLGGEGASGYKHTPEAIQ